MIIEIEYLIMAMFAFCVIAAPSLVKQFGEGHWSPIARALNEALNKSESTGRIGKQCRERWNHHLSPGLRKGPWTPEEEAMVVDAHKRFGNRWSDIARCISGRSENAVKVRCRQFPRRLAALASPGPRCLVQNGFYIMPFLQLK